MHEAASKDLDEGLKVEVKSALAGETPQSVVLLQRPDRLPRALITDEAGVCHSRVLTYADLLGALDQSVTIDQLEREPERRITLPHLPPSTVLVDLIERAAEGANSYVLTGVLDAQEHLFTLEGSPGTDGEQETATYQIDLPPVVYRALYNEASHSVTELSVGLLSPETDGNPAPETTVYRWCFSNVYSEFGGVMEGVCWYQKEGITLAPHRLPELVRRFVSIPNYPSRYTRDLTTNSPHTGYAELLGAIEKRGGIPHEWLVPAGLTIQELHDQRGRNTRP